MKDKTVSETMQDELEPIFNKETLSKREQIQLARKKQLLKKRKTINTYK